MGYSVEAQVSSSLMASLYDEPAWFDIPVTGPESEITARNRELASANKALRQRVTELEARNRDLESFAHTVAHDLKGLVCNLAGYAEYLQGDHEALHDDEVLKCMGTIRESALKMDNIIDELLLLAGVRHTQATVEPLNMAGIVDEAQSRLAQMVGKHQAEVILPDAAAWPTAIGYAPWVEEVWVNYLSNAITYGGQPPRVELGAKRVNDTARFWVRDNGCGLTLEEQDRLFAPFVRLDQVHTKGHGLGLSIVQHIVEKLGGQVGVESTRGQGSVFSFTLPVVRQGISVEAASG